MEICSTLIDRQVHIIWNCQSRVTAIDEELLIMMKRAGCECIQLGVESGSPRILRQLGKNIALDQIVRACAIIKKVGINLSIYLISDIPGETADDVRQTIELVRNIHPDDGYVSPLAYYPGTILLTDAIASGISGKNIFTDSKQNALYAASNPRRAPGRLLKEISNNRVDDPSRFNRHKVLLGYCYTTNILAGEYYQLNGDHISAEREYKEITDRQPDNPWGWFLLGELYSEMGRVRKAGKCFDNVLKIVPRHGPSMTAVAA